MRKGESHGSSNRLGFFLIDLKNSITEENLMEESYTLVNKIGFSYTEVRSLTKKERMFYLNLYIKEEEAERKALEG